MKRFRIEKKTAIKCIGILAPLAAAAIIVRKEIRPTNAWRGSASPCELHRGG